MSSKPNKQEEHSEVIRKDARTHTRPGTSNSRATSPGVGPSETVVDKSLRPSLFRWRSWQVSESFRNYAERAARGEKLARFEGSILANPHQHLPEAPPTQRYIHRATVRPPAWLLDPKSLLWNTWVWGSLGLAFAIGLFAFTVWITAPKEELYWAPQATAPAAPASTSVAVRAARPARKTPAPEPVAPAPVVTEPEPPPSEAVTTTTAAAPAPAPVPAAATPAAVAPVPARAPAVASAPAKPPEAKPAPPSQNSVQEVRDALNRLEGTVANANGSRTVSPSAATNKPVEAPTPTAPTATTSASATASAAPAPPTPKRDPLLVEAPSF